MGFTLHSAFKTSLTNSRKFESRIEKSNFHLEYSKIPFLKTAHTNIYLIINRSVNTCFSSNVTDIKYIPACNSFL